MNLTVRIFQVSLILILTSCSEVSHKNLLNDYPPLNESGQINVVIEIPAGTTEKWELDKTDGILKWEKVDGKNRIINYLGYPGNYGFIPQTLLDKESGGDGDPLDVLVIGPPEERGSVISCKLIGVLYLIDRGEQDDKLIAVSEKSTLSEINSLEEIDSLYPGITDIIRIWFTNYKGSGLTSTDGYGKKEQAMQMVNSAFEAYEKRNPPG